MIQERSFINRKKNSQVAKSNRNKKCSKNLEYTTKETSFQATTAIKTHLSLKTLVKTFIQGFMEHTSEELEVQSQRRRDKTTSLLKSLRTLTITITFSITLRSRSRIHNSNNNTKLKELGNSIQCKELPWLRKITLSWAKQTAHLKQTWWAADLLIKMDQCL